jgi:hypothetical protein
LGVLSVTVGDVASMMTAATTIALGASGSPGADGAGLGSVSLCAELRVAQWLRRSRFSGATRTPG